MPRKVKAQAVTPRKVAILGYTTHNQYAPWSDPTWELWGINDLHDAFEQYAPKVFEKAPERVRWFQLHRPEPDGSFHGARDPAHFKKLQEAKYPIYMWDAHPEVPMSRVYPIRDVLKWALANHGHAYFNNTISWLIALALMEGVDELAVFGVDMALDGVHGQSEYGHQRPSVEYWLGVARGMGVTLRMHQEAELLKCAFLYGWDNVTAERRKLLTRFDQLGVQEAQAVTAYEGVKRGKYEVQGAIAERELILRAHLAQERFAKGDLVLSGPDDLQKLVGELHNVEDARLAALRQNLAQAEQDFGDAGRVLEHTRGAKNDVEWLLRNYFPGDGAVQDVPRSPRSLTPEDVQGTP